MMLICTRSPARIDAAFVRKHGSANAAVEAAFATFLSEMRRSVRAIANGRRKAPVYVGFGSAWKPKRRGSK